MVNSENKSITYYRDCRGYSLLYFRGVEYNFSFHEFTMDVWIYIGVTSEVKGGTSSKIGFPIRYRLFLPLTEQKSCA